MIHTFTRHPAGLASGGRTRRRTRTVVLVGAAVAAIGTAACKDSVVPNFRSPQVNASSPSGIQYLVTGVVAGSRTDIGVDTWTLSSFARDMGVFTNTDNRFITEVLGDGTTIPNSDFYGTNGWSNAFRIDKDAQFVIDQLPHVVPAYSASDASLIAGVMKTFQAYNMMLDAETRDTVGVPVFGWATPAATPAPIFCVKDVWGSIAAMLDSAEGDLDAGTPGPLPISLPPGFTVASMAGPSGTMGTFAGFNRALAAYAKLQWAYGVTRSPGGIPATPSTPGSPLVSALTAADSAIHATFLYNPAALAPANAGDFTDPLAVYHNFSSASGDVANPITFAAVPLQSLFVLDTVVAEITAGGDNRAIKLMPNSVAPGQPKYNAVVSKGITIGMYSSPSSPVPIIRNEELVLIEAMIQLGLGNTVNAIAAINAVRTSVGGVAPYAGPATYTAVRDQILHELRLSNIAEPGEERVMAMRNYGLQAQLTQTWGTVDTHATLLPVPITEAGPRKNKLTPTCS